MRGEATVYFILVCSNKANDDRAVSLIFCVGTSLTKHCETWWVSRSYTCLKSRESFFVLKTGSV